MERIASDLDLFSAENSKGVSALFSGVSLMVICQIVKNIMYEILFLKGYQIYQYTEKQYESYVF